MRLAPIVGVMSTLALMILVSTATALPTDPVTEKIGRWCEGPDPPIAYKEDICARLHRAKEERRAARLAAAQVEVAPVAPPAPTTVAPASGGYAIDPSIVACESGGDYNAVNPSSGAYGAYQILPSTSAALGCDMSTPAGQDACAAEVMATQGRGAWVC